MDFFEAKKTFGLYGEEKGEMTAWAWGNLEISRTGSPSLKEIVLLQLTQSC